MILTREDPPDRGVLAERYDPDLVLIQSPGVIKGSARDEPARLEA